MRWVGYVARMGEKKNIYRDFVRQPELMRPVERPSFRWEDNIKMDLKGTGYVVMDELM